MSFLHLVLGSLSHRETAKTMIKLCNLKEERENENPTFLWMLECDMHLLLCFSGLLWLGFGASFNFLSNLT